jgi:hypothetical protein
MALTWVQMQRIAGRALIDRDFRRDLREDPAKAALSMQYTLTSEEIAWFKEVVWKEVARIMKDIQKSLKNFPGDPDDPNAPKLTWARGLHDGRGPVLPRPGASRRGTAGKVSAVGKKAAPAKKATARKAAPAKKR